MDRVRRWVSRPLDQRTLPELVVYRLRWALLALLVLFGAATIGLIFTDGYGWIDAAYMSVITLSTVGFGEVKPLDTAGRLFIIFVIIASFATFVYAVSVLTNLFTSGEAVRHLQESKGRRMREGLHDHVIVVGFGRVGQAVARGVQEMGRACIVIDRNHQREEQIRSSACVALIGDATSEADLIHAGIERATALVAAAEHDEINLIVTLTARSMRADLRIVSRVNEEDWRARIVHAGATVAQSPYTSYGMSLAASAITPAVLDVHDLPLLGLGTEEIRISPASGLIGTTIGSITADHPGVLVVGLRRERTLRRWHDVDGPVSAGDILVVLGTPESLQGLAQTA